MNWNPSIEHCQDWERINPKPKMSYAWKKTMQEEHIAKRVKSQKQSFVINNCRKGYFYSSVIYHNSFFPATLFPQYFAWHLRMIFFHNLFFLRHFFHYIFFTMNITEKEDGALQMKARQHQQRIQCLISDQTGGCELWTDLIL